MFWLLFHFSCVSPLEKAAEDFWDNPNDDHDEDGLTEQDGDCDDRNDTILGPSLWYADADEDGFGDPSQGVTACLDELLSEDLSYVANGDDCNDSDASTYPGSSREGGELCVRDSDNDGYGDSTASQPYDAGTDCNDVDESIFPNNAQYEDDDLCVVDSDGDGYGDAIPSVNADAGHDCDDSNPLVYPGYNNEQGNLCILDSDGDGFGQVNAPQPYDSGTDCDDSNVEVYPNQRELCDLMDNDCNGTVDDALPIDSPVWYVDADGDGFGAIDYPLSACPDAGGNGPEGYVSSFNDCDDTHALSHPYLEGFEGGVELCDSEGRDENCDGVVNDPSALDAVIWYQDSDSDGYGSVFINQRQCDQPLGYVEDNTDCNDSEPNSHPNNPESCDFVDNDCDGVVDESDAVDAVNYYFDADGDGYGNLADLTVACPLNEPVNHVTNASDCNDGNASQNPSALEQCNGEDDDCDGDTDEDNGTDPPEGSPTWYLDADQDLFGDENNPVVSCLAPADHVAAAGDCNDSDPFIHPDADEECSDSIDENCDGDPVYGVPTDLLPTWYPDSDGDTYGNPDFVIQLCVQPQNYVPNAGDCNDTDYYVHPLDSGVHAGEFEPDGVTPYVHRELCNGKLDVCENDLLGDLTPLDIELDDDGDGFVDCALDVDVLFWEHPTVSILGGDDCDDTSDYRYPAAPERCNGIYDDCDSLVTFGGFPSDEVDDDLDCFVECTGFDAAQWEGGAHSCAYRDLNSITVNETTVIGGDDCNDTAEYTYIGAAPQTNPSTCLTDFDGDGLSDRSWDLCPTEMSYADARYLLQGTVSGANIQAKSGGDVTGDGIWDIIYDGYGGGTDNRIHLMDIGSFSQQSPILDQNTWTYKEDPIASQTFFAFVGDVDGDGLQDFATSNSQVNSTYSDAGRIAVSLSSNFVSAFGSETSNNHSVMFTGQANGEELNNIYAAGDIDQDGYEEVFIKSKTFVDFSPIQSMNLFLGSTLMSEIGNDLNPYNADCHFLEMEAGLAMNLDGDSLPDYVLFYRDSRRNGESYIYLGANLTPNSGIYTHSDADRAILGQLYRHVLTPIGAGDINGDGLDDLFLKEFVDGMGFHIYLSETVMNATSELYLEDADVTFRGGENSPDTPFMISLGDLDSDGLDEIIMGWTGDYNGVFNENYASLFLGSTVMAALNDSVDDSGFPLNEPLILDVTDADFVFPDVKDASRLGDIDLDGLGEFLLSNKSYSYAEAGGGVNGIFSACEN